MTKKDFVAIAKIINASYQAAKKLDNEPHTTSYQQFTEQVAAALAGMLKIDNDRFDINKFMIACGIYDY